MLGKYQKNYQPKLYNKYMPYRSYAELVADRFHTDLPFLKKLNPKKDMKKLQPGNELKVPNAPPFLIEKISDKKAPKNENFLKESLKLILKIGYSPFMNMINY